VNSFVCLLCLSSSQTIPKLIHDMKSSCFVVAEKKERNEVHFFFIVSHNFVFIVDESICRSELVLEA